MGGGHQSSVLFGIWVWARDGLLVSGLVVDLGMKAWHGVRDGLRLSIWVRDGVQVQAGIRLGNWMTDQGWGEGWEMTQEDK